MARLDVFDRDLQLATADLEPAAIQKALANFARSSLREAIYDGGGTGIYDKYVNGRYGADEGTVVPPGPILYVFHHWTEIIEFGLDLLARRSPVKSGRYRSSWFAYVAGQVVTDPDRIPINSVVYLTNDRPYSRKIETGHMKMSVEPGVVEDCKSQIMGRYGNLITASKTMINLPNNYVLKGVFRKGIRPHSRTKIRPDTSAGALMTYPALKMQMRE